MSELPEGWAEVSFTDVFDIQGGTQPPKSTFVYEATDGYVQLLQIRDFGEKPVPTFIPDAKGLKKCTEDDVLIARYGASLGRILTGHKGAYNVAMAKVVIPPQVDRGFTYYLLKSDAFQAPLKLVSRSAQNGFNREDLAGFQLPLAPYAEQKRIAGKLEVLLGRVDGCRERLEAVGGILKRFRQSVLAAATSGRLTEDWREANGGGEEWREDYIEAVAQVGTGSTPLRSNSLFFANNGTPWITSAATSQRTVMKAEEFVTDAAITAHRLKIYPIGTLLVAMYGEGKTRGQVTELGIAATINQACAAINVNEAIVSRLYVRISLEANYLEMRELAEGGNQPNLNLTKIKEFPLNLPPLAEQQEIVRRVETLFALADQLEARLSEVRTTVERLTPALLAKAFRGELVAQDPTDEPASALLERLRAGGVDGTKGRRGTRKRR